MKYRILCIGKIKDSFYREAVANFCNQVRKRNHHIEIIEFPDERIPEHFKENRREAFLEKECRELEKKISAKDYVIALCIEGKEITSMQHKGYVDQAVENGFDSITYVIGGSLGLPEGMKRRSNLKLSFSKMTFPHQMMRMVLCEEIVNITA